MIASICIAIAARSVDKALLADHKATSIALFMLSDTGRVKEGKVFYLSHQPSIKLLSACEAISSQSAMLMKRSFHDN